MPEAQQTRAWKYIFIYIYIYIKKEKGTTNGSFGTLGHRTSDVTKKRANPFACTRMCLCQLLCYGNEFYSYSICNLS